MDDFLARMKHPYYERIVQALHSETPIYLVGGAVRDMLSGRPSFDLDFVTSENALSIGRQLANDLGGAYFPLDPVRNVARIVLTPDDRSDGKSIKVDISRFQGKDLEHDLRGRDFTINAIAVDVRHPETLLDPLNGAQDLLEKRLRACSENSLRADPVRILRAVRLSVDLELRIPSETLHWMREATALLPEVSAERIRDELFRMLAQAHPSTAVRILEKVGVLEYVLPELCFLKDVKQGSPHVMDVWDHTLDILNRLEDLIEVLSPNYDPDKVGSLSLGLVVMRLGRYRNQLAEHLESSLNPDRPHRGLIYLAGLYHDVGKMVTHSIDSRGIIHFIGHEQAGSQMADKRGQALKLSKLEITRLVTIVNHHMRPSMLSHPAEPPSIKSVYRFFKDTGAAGVDICLLSLADVLATYGPTLPQERWARHLEVIRTLLGAWWEEKEVKVLPIALVKGDDLISELGLPSGPIVGYLLESLREAQVNGEISNRDQALNLARKILIGSINN